MFESLTIPVVIGAAAIDSVNPCAFAVLIFLLTYLMFLGSKKKVLQIGVVYIFVVFLTYFLAGMGILSVIQSFHVTRIVYYAAAVLVILAGLINIKDFFWYGKGLTLQIPESTKDTIEKYIKKASIPAAIVLGFLVAAFELPCTGGVYLAILGLLANESNRFFGILYLLLYNIIFVLPLFIIMFLVLFGFSKTNELESWRIKKRKYMKLSLGLGMVVLGILMFLGVL